ncbi:hypothetical protein EVAR_85716_1 [Eumeta japonica]|uniref:Uncharacterized protein n=1 Tax=Eumeta variegata TaxID=151549 RepID=A0A4C1Y243_EUMVA|nr:hypothetical protein EVAR_85716_1 [Eumeta japonica]
MLVHDKQPSETLGSTKTSENPLRPAEAFEKVCEKRSRSEVVLHRDNVSAHFAKPQYITALRTSSITPDRHGMQSAHDCPMDATRYTWLREGCHCILVSDVIQLTVPASRYPGLEYP